MICPKCGDKRAECIINNFWNCPTCHAPKNISPGKTYELYYNVGIDAHIAVIEYSYEKRENEFVKVISSSPNHDTIMIDGVEGWTYQEGKDPLNIKTQTVSFSSLWDNPIKTITIDHKSKTIIVRR